MINLPSKQDVAEQTAIQWIAALQSPSLTKEEEQSFFEWLEKSPENQSAYLKAEQLWEQGQLLQHVTPKEESSFFDFSWLFHSIPATGTAMCFCFALIYSVYTFLPSQNWSQAYATTLGEQKTVTLPDDSTVLMNTNTQLSIEYTENNRTVRLTSGEAFFSVSSNPNRPFDVVTAGGSVRVLGTQFSVDASLEDTLVTVLEGKVALADTLTPKENFVAATTLTQNQQLSIADATIGTAPKKVDAVGKLSWRNKKLIYRGEKLIDVIQDINRYYESKLFLDDLALGEKEVIAVLQLDDFASTLNTLKRSLNLESSINDEMTRITLRSAEVRTQ